MRKEDALQKLQRQRDLIDDLKLKPRFSQDFKKWHRDTEVAIEKIFGSDERQIADFKKIDYGRPSLALYAIEQKLDQKFISGLDNAKTVLESLIQEIDEYSLDEKNSIIDKKHYVDPERIAELRSINNPRFDLGKLIRTCEELNVCFSNSCFLSVVMLVRSIIDHVPPVFGVKGFAEVANNYNGTKSFKDSMQHLSNSSRKIADAHLHTQIRNKESLPNEVQVNFSNDLDVLLGEIVRILG